MKFVRHSTYFLAIMATLFLLSAVMMMHAQHVRVAERPRLERISGMVGTVGLTDLCLFTEASYTRNPSQADLHTPFQDHPLSLEHFPSGSLTPPPERRN